ncbi:Alpha-beta barrel containing sulfiredoxin superfamily protein [Desulfonema limicola]|uniref:Alpha-beta barrel containing sulfiredoxin superfamily protein n=1 Tax=Desulfonema limicola TaxID=45656 RepID=A0A975B807_9BACT|nr:Lrp/AsnC ligand binding domain-containing protein [Desulfonema limicola]QTA80523.1 Alpha-beta barrel containing sulfiredoxin superfamily protein [Desulfonema limicola]
MTNRIAAVWKSWRNKNKLKSFKENQLVEEAYDARDLGIKTIELSRIVGSVGRYLDFDSRFRLKTDLPSERMERVKKAMLEGKSLPPVALYQIKDEYYIMDGNHRVAAAKALGRKTINAHILEFLPSRKTLENVLYLEKNDFIEKTGLKFPIEITEVGQYSYLLEQIKEHQQSLEKVNKTQLPFQTAAKDWYQTIYCPFIEIIERSRLSAAFSRRTTADLYAYISYHQWEKGRKRSYGIGLDQIIPKNMEEFRAQIAEKQGFEFPEMKRLITAFVFIHVKAGQEHRIMEKIFKLEEVKELYDVPGDFDLFAKIVMERDWLSSDSEVIGFFVYNNIRQISDVIKTQTLIPISSKRK